MATSRPDAAADPASLASPPVAWAGVVVLVAVHLVALVLVGEEAGLATIAAFEGVVLAVVAGLEVGVGPASLRDGAVLLGTWVVLVVGTWLATEAATVTVVAFGLVAVVGLVAYGLHRYQLVALGLVEVADERD